MITRLAFAFKKKQFATEDTEITEKIKKHQHEELKKLFGAPNKMTLGCPLIHSPLPRNWERGFILLRHS